MKPFDRSRIRFRPVAERKSKFRIDDIAVPLDEAPPDPGSWGTALDGVAASVREARGRGAPVVLCHGAHLIKNGLGPLLVRLVEEGWVTHVATNGAGSIHDWEFAYLGRSTEDVRANVAVGEFGTWDETGRLIGLALHLGAWQGLGYGGAVGRMVVDGGLELPSAGALEEEVRREVSVGGDAERAANAAHLLHAARRFGLRAGRIDVPHPWRRVSVQAACWERGVPCTIHPGFGQDIVYSHPAFRGGVVGQTAETDFLLYAASIERLQGGVYLSVGSSVMSPMIFEKSLSMSRNVALQAGGRIDRFEIVVNDIADVTWDWSSGEPPIEHPAYYVRFCKTFSRMGGTLRYVGMDNRAFLLGLWSRLGAAPGP